jgi:hypothetical protein
MSPARGTSFGWDDCPPRPDAAEGAPDGLRLRGTDRSNRRAQRFFHAVLVQFLADRKLTVERMISERIEGFWLRFTEKELDDLLESAAEEYSDVERIGEQEDVDRKYKATEKGERLRPPQSLSLTDPANVLRITREAVQRWWPAFVAVGGLIGITGIISADEAWKREVAIAALVLSFLFLVLLFGYFGEQVLKEGARAWPRLAVYRPAFYAWVTHPWRQAFFPAAGWLLVALLVLALLFLRWETAATLVAFGLAGVVGIAIGVAFLRVRSMRKASAEERDDVENCRSRKATVAS